MLVAVVNVVVKNYFSDVHCHDCLEVPQTYLLAKY